MPPPEPDRGSLDDSWASIADVESSNEDDLQSENTDVGSLLDVHSSDDIQSVSDGIHINDVASSDEEGLEDTLTEELDRRSTLKPSSQQELFSHPPPPRVPQIVYSVQDVGPNGLGPICIYTISRPLAEADTRKSLPHGQDGSRLQRYFSIIRMPVLGGGLDLDAHNYFKVLLLGQHVEQFRPEIQRKLGDVLVSRPVTSNNTSPTSVSRFHLVPNTFGPGSEPDFADLVAIDKLIDFDCYDLVHSSSGLGQQEQLILQNSQTHSEIVSKWSGSGFVVCNPRWTLPDLAIICVHLDAEGKMNSDSCKMISFVERHGIPKILIRMNRGWAGDYRDCVNADSLHECIETRTLPPRLLQHKVSPKLPLDMAAFLNLDATALNKHIAYAVSSAEQTRAGEIDDLDLLSKEHHEKPSGTFSTFPRANAFLIKNVFIVLWIVGVYSFLGLRLWPILSDPTPGATTGDIMANITVQEQARSTGTQLSMSTFATFTDSPRNENQVAQQLLDIASINVVPAVADDALHFQVSIAGESQLLVRLPKIALSRKKRSPLSVELKRENQTVPVSVHELLDGVFGVLLQPHDTYGDIEVNLTMSKPQISETLTVSFGDRPSSEFQRLKELFGMLSGHIHETTLSISSFWKDMRERMTLDDLRSLPRLAREKVQQQKSTNSIWQLLDISTLSDGQSRLRREMQTLNKEMVRMAQSYVMPGRKLGDVLSEGLFNARLRLLGAIESVDIPRFSPNFDNKAILHRLAAAQGRARQIVTKATKKFRAPNALA
ncbi:uncharacterized protein A1O5_01823 [Cladophialophora psammophila CBS 110553]|uniref:Uncharacterized protein n=1 Tax=Cladophialophora psammophila CBS 110553 TaxID=1182543 RepID=W9X3R1_9EURO|nr:uncharacterized protein A1O5_01823 [Cladophialophora psammophila CBS 110553]EXJ75127.1 hypothetical protein A1O5_01823 [Cladophialophora psammophila CBS 110553]